MEGGFGDDGAIADLPWASVFSPTANARALSAIQAEGFRAASQLVDRFVRAVEAGARPTTNGHAETASPGREQSAGPDLERLTRAWWSMFGQFLLGAAPSAGRAGAGIALGVDGRGAAGSVDMDITGDGWASGEVWLHNNSGEDFGVVQLRCGELISHSGGVIAAAATQCDPTDVPVPARSSRGVALKIHVAPFDPPGIYRGTLVVTGHPDLWLPVALTVRPSS
ncbi:hypothetical protein [Mycobacterium sp. M26]|uniref:hypothetical protein n=1 Tax=Mycobacterium sp. M26 TaxID=1762962 RepID=UPI0009EAD2C0|nr:hypothetical protein [Mycobacterium sp. M26]